jgi:hypothetical protein
MVMTKHLVCYLRQGALRTYRNEDITLTLPEGMTLNDITWFSVWCHDFSVRVPFFHFYLYIFF